MIKSNDKYNWAKPVATGLLVIRLSRPVAAKSAANWVMTRWFYMALGNCISDEA